MNSEEKENSVTFKQHIYVNWCTFIKKGSGLKYEFSNITEVYRG